MAQQQNLADVLSALSALLATLRGSPLARFEAEAVRELGRHVGFDGAVWGTGVSGTGAATPSETLTITRAAVVDRSDALLSEYAEIAPFDPVTAGFLARPTRPARVSRTDYWARAATAPVGDYLERHRIEHLLLAGTCTQDNEHGRVLRWLTVYREGGEAFSAAETERLALLLPFWMQAQGLHRQALLARAPDRPRWPQEACALCDAAGVVHAAEERFTALTGLAEGWRLPEGAGAGNADIVLSAVEWSDSWRLVTARPRRTWPNLTQREDEVAARYVQGAGYKEIATLLGSSPATVRTQIQSVFRKLGVHSRAELSRALRHAVN